MLSLIIGLLTFILVFICAILMVLILAQLPKKDAGAGLAFGSGTAEAIFGAGAGTPLAQITKYCAGIFLGLALTLSALNAYRSNQSTRFIDEEAARKEAEASEMSLPIDEIDVNSMDSIEAIEVVGSDEKDESEMSSGETESTEETEIAEPPQMFEASESPLNVEPLEQTRPDPTLPNPNN